MEKAASVNEVINTKKQERRETIYKLKGNGKYEILELPLGDLLFIESVGNYCDIYYLEADVVKKVTFRSALASFAETLPSNTILKTHRSFLVNLNKVQKVTGNAQGYQLSLQHFDDKTIPVSRANIETFDQYYQ